jgi:hypothetical protein
MKKTYLFLLFSIIIFFCKGQITINSANVVGEGDVVIISHNYDPEGVSIGSNGPNQTWDFSSLEEMELDTLSFENPTGLPGYSDFPESNLALDDSESDSSWVFITKNSSGFFLDGFVEVEEGSLESFSVNKTIITFPSSMGTSFSNSSNLVIGVTPLGLDVDGSGPLEIIDSIKITRSTSFSSNIDGWGELKTPSGTFPSLKQIVLEQTIDTTWMALGGSGVWEVIDNSIAQTLDFNPITIENIRLARWWTNDSRGGYPLLEMDYEEDGTVSSLDWNVVDELVGLPNQHLSGNKTYIYPNPANNQITIETELKNNNRLQLIDITGRTVVKEYFTQRKITLPIKDLKKGIYFYQILDDEGQVLNTNKFIVAK